MILSPGSVTIIGGGSGMSVVGASPQWADGSDATYGEFVVNVANFGDQLSAPLTGTPVTGVQSAELFVRTEHSASLSGSLVRASVTSAAGTAYAGGTLVAGNYYIDVPQGSISEQTDPFRDPSGLTLADVFAGGPCDLRFSWSSSVTGDVIRILEAHVIVTVPEANPYRRIFPRDDGRAGGAPRNYPPSKSRSSNRTSGYL